jgi:hypothetical protein
MVTPSDWSRNRLLLALPASNLKRLMPQLERIPCRSDRILQDSDSALDEVFFPDSGVVSVLAVYADGSTIEMATVGREGLHRVSGLFWRQRVLRPLSRPNPGDRRKDLACSVYPRYGIDAVLPQSPLSAYFMLSLNRCSSQPPATAHTV